MMVQMTEPKPRERIGDLAAGTGGFLVNAYQYTLESNTGREILEYDTAGFPHHLIGDKLTKQEAQAEIAPAQPGGGCEQKDEQDAEKPVHLMGCSKSDA